MLLCDGACLEHVGIQFLLGPSGIHDQHCQHEHALVLALQFLQKGLGVLSVGRQVRGNDIHVVAGTDRLFLFFDLGPVKLRDRMLDGLDRLCLVNGLDVHRDDLAGVHVQKILQELVGQIRCRYLKIAHGTVQGSHLEGTAAGEGKGRWSNEILHRKPGTDKPFPVEAELIIRIAHVEHVVHELEPVVAVQDLRPDAQLFEVVQEIVLHMLQPGLCLLHGVRLDTESQILGLGQTVIALGKLVPQHLRVLLADGIKAVVLKRDPYTGLEAVCIRGHVHEGQFKMDGTIEKV